MTEETQQAPSPYGRYFAPLWQRLLQPIGAVLCTTSLIIGSSPWRVPILITFYLLIIALTVPQWFIPPTIIDEYGFTLRWRWPLRQRQIGWSEVRDAHLDHTVGKCVVLLLSNGAQVRAIGVPEGAIEGIRQIAAGTPAHSANQT